MKILNFETYSKRGTKKRGQVKSCVCNGFDLYSQISPRFNNLLILIFYGLLFFLADFSHSISPLHEL